MNGFFKSLKTCGTLLNRVRVALGEICRRVVGAEGFVARAFTSAKAGNDAPLSDKSAPASNRGQAETGAGGAARCALPEPVEIADTKITETSREDQAPEVAQSVVAVSGPVCRMVVSVGYVPPARGISVLLRELERV